MADAPARTGPDWDKFTAILSRLSPEDFLQQVSYRRFGQPASDPDVAAIPEEYLSMADRFAHAAVVANAARANLGDLGTAAGFPIVAAGFTGYEALKAAGGPKLLDALSFLHEQLKSGSNTSPASWGNVEAPLRGYIAATRKQRADEQEALRGSLGAPAAPPPQLAGGGVVIPGLSAPGAPPPGTFPQVPEFNSLALPGSDLAFDADGNLVPAESLDTTPTTTPTTTPSTTPQDFVTAPAAPPPVVLPVKRVEALRAPDWEALSKQADLSSSADLLHRLDLTRHGALAEDFTAKEAARSARAGGPLTFSYLAGLPGSILRLGADARDVLMRRLTGELDAQGNFIPGETFPELAARGALTPAAKHAVDQLERHAVEVEAMLRDGRIRLPSDQQAMLHDGAAVRAFSQRLVGTIADIGTDPAILAPLSAAGRAGSALLAPMMIEGAADATGRLWAGLQDGDGKLTPEVAQAAADLLVSGPLAGLTVAHAAGGLAPESAVPRMEQLHQVLASKDLGNFLDRLPSDVRRQVEQPLLEALETTGDWRQAAQRLPGTLGDQVGGLAAKPYLDPATGKLSSEAGVLILRRRPPEAPADLTPPGWADLDWARYEAQLGPTFWSRLSAWADPMNLWQTFIDRQGGRGGPKHLAAQAQAFLEQNNPSALVPADQRALSGYRLPSDPRLVLDEIAAQTPSRARYFRITYDRIGKEAQAAGLRVHTLMNRQLDLYAWRRALEVVEARRGAAQGREAQALADARTAPKGSAKRARAAAQLRDARAEITALQKRLADGAVVPLGKSLKDLASDEAFLQQGAAPQEWQQASALTARVHALNRQILDLYEAAGIVSPEVHQELVARGDSYVPLTRIVNQVGHDSGWAISSNLSLPVRRYLQQFQGSKLYTIAPLEASTLAAIRAMSDISRNRAARSVLEIHQIAPQVTTVPRVGMGPQRPTFRLLQSGDKPRRGEGTISHWVAGKKERWAVPQEIAEVQGMANDPGLAGRALRFTQGLLRYGTTSGNLAFMIYNVPRDIHETVNLSPDVTRGVPIGLKHAYYLSRWLQTAATDVIHESPDYMTALWDGALGSNTQRSFTPESYILPHGEGRRLHQVLLDWLATPSNITEEATKVVGYKLLRERGISREEAAYETRENIGTPNALRKGRVGSDANALFMFLNVNTQGKVRMWRRFKQRPWQVIGPLAVGAFATNMALLQHNSQYLDAEGNPEYFRVPPDERRDFHILFFPDEFEQAGIPTRNPENGRRRYLRIRKGDTQQLIHNIVETALWKEFAASKPAWAAGAQVQEAQPQWGTTLADLVNQAAIPGNVAVSPGQPGLTIGRSVGAAMNPIIRVPLERAMNFQFYTGTPIIPRREEGMSAELQYDARTSPFAVVIGQAAGADALSPRTVEHLVRGMFGGLSEEALAGLDLAAQGLSPQVRPAREGFEKIPFVSSIHRRLIGGRRDAERERLSQQFYQQQADLQRVVKGDVPHLLKTAAPGELDKYFKRHDLAGLPEYGIMKGTLEALDQIAKGKNASGSAPATPGLNDLYAELRTAKTPADAKRINDNILELFRVAHRVMRQGEAARKALRASQGGPFGKPPVPVGTPPPPGPGASPWPAGAYLDADGNVRDAAGNIIG